MFACVWERKSFEGLTTWRQQGGWAFENGNIEVTFSSEYDSDIKSSNIVLCLLYQCVLIELLEPNKAFKRLCMCLCVSVPGPEPEDQPVLHPDQQYCLTPCRQPLLHPPSCHAWPGRQQGLRLRLCHQSHLDTGEQGQRDYRWDLHTDRQRTVLKMHINVKYSVFKG